MKNLSLSILAILFVASCGVKPARVSPPPGADPNAFPRAYPAPDPADGTTTGNDENSRREAGDR